MKQIRFEIKVPYVPAIFTSFFPRGEGDRILIHRCHFGLYQNIDHHSLSGFNVIDLILRKK